MENPAIAALFDDTADLLELDGANPFRVRAYRNAARVVRDLGHPLSDLAKEGPKALTDLPGIGKDLADAILAILATGDFPIHGELVAKFPAGLREMLRLPNLGPKRAKLLHDTLGVRSPAELKAALERGDVQTIKGFGQRSADKLLEALERMEPADHRMLLAEAEQFADPVVAHMRTSTAVQECEAAGSLRRRRETVGDLDILVATTRPAATIKHFLAFPDVAEVLARGETKASVRLTGGPQVDLRVVKPEEFGAALHYFTGSKAHNVELRKLAQARGLKLNEYGLFRGKRRVAGKDEADIFETLGLTWIPPELREARGEIGRARKKRLPTLITERDIRGELHAHTDATDGRATLEEMVEAARELGYGYLAITDHSQRVTMARGLDGKRLRAQWKEIDRLNARLEGFTVLRGVELDILEGGRLDLPDDVLRDADYVVASLHYGAGPDAARNTRRLVSAACHRYVDAIGHPTGRLINRREPYPLNIDELLDACAGEGCFLELNGSPERMDLPDHLAIAAAERGICFVCATDSHATSHLKYMRFAVSLARRAGLDATQVANTRTVDEFRGLLKRSAL